MNKKTLLLTASILVVCLLGNVGVNALIITNDWIRYDENPVIDGTPGTWDAMGIRNPCVLKIDDTYMMWYHAESEVDGEDYIGLATSTDGKIWVKSAENPILTTTTEPGWEHFRLSSPMVIYDDGIYKMWYGGCSHDAYTRIGYAESADGISWTKHANNPIFDTGSAGEWDDHSVAHCYVLKEDGSYKMWYTGRSNADKLSRIGYATSTDGINWVKYSGNPIIELGNPGTYDSLLAAHPEVVLDEGKYLMWYSGISATGDTITSIAYATSNDGITWEKALDNPVLEPIPGSDWENVDVASPTIVKGDGILEMWYTGRSIETRRYMTVGYALMFTSPEQAVEQLINEVNNLNLQQGIENSLISRLQTLQEYLEADNGNGAIPRLEALITFIEQQSTNNNPKITLAQADFLIEQIQAIIALI